MVSKAPGVVRQGTADDLAKSSVGYSASGASEHSRNSAHSANLKGESYIEPLKPVWTRTQREQHADKIARQERLLVKLHSKLNAACDPERRKKFASDIKIKTAFIARLKSEQQ